MTWERSGGNEWHHAPGNSQAGTAISNPIAARLAQALEARVAPGIDNPLKCAVTANQHELVAQIGRVVLIGFGIQEVNSGKLAVAPPCRGQASRAAYGQEFALHAALLEPAEQVI